MIVNSESHQYSFFQELRLAQMFLRASKSRRMCLQNVMFLELLLCHLRALPLIWLLSDQEPFEKGGCSLIRCKFRSNANYFYNREGSRILPKYLEHDDICCHLILEILRRPPCLWGKKEKESRMQ